MTKQYDPRMHTAEHLLNSTMDRWFSCGRCYSAHINKKKSKCDYHFDRHLNPDEIQALQDAINLQIERDLEVTVSVIDKEAARDRFDLDRVPEVEGLENVRIVHIGDYDACPCIGPHVESTGSIGRFRITTTDYADGVLRIRFKLD